MMLVLIEILSRSKEGGREKEGPYIIKIRDLGNMLKLAKQNIVEKITRITREEISGKRNLYQSYF
jgi:hypothetical protein